MKWISLLGIVALGLFWQAPLSAQEGVESTTSQEDLSRRFPSSGWRSGNSSSEEKPKEVPATVPGEQSPAPASQDATVQGAPPAATIPAASELESTAPEHQLSPLQQQRVLIQELLKNLPNATHLDEPTRADLTKRATVAGEWLTHAEEAAAKTIEYNEMIRLAPTEISRVRESLGTALPEPARDPTVQETLSTLDARLRESEAALAKATSSLAKCDDDLRKRTERKNELVQLIGETTTKLSDNQRLQQAAATANEYPELGQIRRIEIESRRIALESLLALYRAEAKKIEARTELFPLLRDQAIRTKKQEEKRVLFWQTEVARVRKLESENDAREARRQAKISHPNMRILLERNTYLAELRQKLAKDLTSATAQLNKLDSTISNTQTEFTKAKERVTKAGHSTTVGLMLRRMRAELPTREQCEARRRFVSEEMPRINLIRIELDDERAELADIPEACQAVMTELGLPDDPVLVEAVKETLSLKRDTLYKLNTECENYITDLSELELRNSNLSAQITEISSYVDEHVLWIRSTEPLWSVELKDSIQSVKRFGDPTLWTDVARIGGLDVLQQPVVAAFVFVISLIGIGCRARVLKKSREICSTKNRTTALHIAPTIQVLLLDAFAAASWPLLIAYLGFRLTLSTDRDSFAIAVGVAMSYLALVFWALELLRHLSRPNGLAESHFNWSSHGLRRLRGELRLLALTGVPLGACAIFAEEYDQGELGPTLGRIAFIVGMGTVAKFSYSLLGSRSHVFAKTDEAEQTSWHRRVRVIGCLLGVGIPLSLIAMASLGYYYSALHLSGRLQISFGMVLCVVLTYAVISRWILVRRRNLALQQMKSKSQENAATTDSVATSPVTIPDDSKLDLSAIHSQLQVFLRHGFTVVTLVACWFIWSDVLPALKVFDKVVLWEETVDVVELIKNAQGVTVSEKVPTVVETTLRHLFVAVLAVGTMVLLGRHLPALLTITVLNRLPLDRGGRHAISMIVHYGIVLTGVVLGCRVLNIGWQSVQWLVAGMTVGLGFGLQEIFANFVSGMILLFERPIRVGDIITLGDVTGTVTDIRIRATTVTNWERKELIVPNKDLITGRLLNWTLSDSTNRVVIPIGIAYSSDTDLAREILLSIVESHPNVLKDPPPVVTFEGFGESSLTFTVRVFLGTMEIRLVTINELHSTILKRFRESGIEIAFPQRDLNIRNIAAPRGVRLADDEEDESQAA